MDYAQCTDLELLRSVFGNDFAGKVYRGNIAPLFFPKGEPAANPEQMAPVRELVTRWMDRGCTLPPPLSTHALARNYVDRFFAGQEFESVVVFFLDAECQLTGEEVACRGAVPTTGLPVRAIVKSALDRNTAAVVVAHHQPAMTAGPISIEARVAAPLQRALMSVDVEVRDYIFRSRYVVASLVDLDML